VARTRSRRIAVAHACLVIASIGVALQHDDAPEVATAAAADTNRYVPVGPCRLLDQRTGEGIRAAAGQHVVSDVDASRCAVPDGATALLTTITVTGPTRPGFTVGHATGTPQPEVAHLNYLPGETRANGALIPIGDDGTVTFFRLDGVDSGALIVDVVGAFVPAPTSAAGRFVAPDTASRLLDTRDGGASRPPDGTTIRVPIPDHLPTDTTAIAVTAVLVDTSGPGFLTLSPAGAPRPIASTVNADGTRQVRSGTTVVPVTADGFDVFIPFSSHVVIDMTGWFTGASADESSDGLFVIAPQQRLVDTRPWPTPINPDGTIDISVPNPPHRSGAAAALTSITMIRSDRPSYVTAHATGVARGEVSSGNTIGDEFVAQATITATSSEGISLYSLGRVDVTVDLFGWFTGTPAAPDGSPRPGNPTPLQRVMTVGDSAHAGMERNGSFGALRGASFEVRGESCRRLVRPSCDLRGTGAPPTALDTLRSTPYGAFDVLVIQTGYNDQMPAYAGHIRQVLDEARRAGFRRIVWFAHSREFRSDKGGADAFQVYSRHNAELRALAGVEPDVTLVEWGEIVRPRPDFLDPDGIHLRRGGGFALADAISRSVAHVTGQPCPMPEVPGAPVPNPCPNPGTRPTIEPTSLYDLDERIVPCAKEGPLGETICRWTN